MRVGAARAEARRPEGSEPLRELRQAVRTLARSPGFAALALGILGLTTGLNAVVFSLVNALLLRPLPVAAPQELLRIYSSTPGELMSHAPMSSADWDTLRRECRSFAAVSASFLTTGALDDGSGGRLVVAEIVSADYFETLGVGAASGRPLLRGDADGAETANPWGGESVAVLSHTSWRRRFGADPGVVGRTLRLDGRPITVVGIAERGFFGLARGLSPELWLPMGEPGAPTRAARAERSLWLVGRLAPGAAAGGARQELAALAERLRREYPDTHSERDFAALPSSEVRLLPGLDAALRPAALAVLGVVGLSLLIANANLGQLLLVRGLQRRREIAIRLSLGAPRARLAGQLLSEGLVLAAAGGLVGLVLAAVAPALFDRWTSSLPVDVDLGLVLDWRVALFTLSLPTLTTLVFATAPALEATRPALLIGLRRGEFGGVPGQRRLRQGLVAAQLALAFVALVAAGEALAGLAGALAADTGFEAAGAAVASLAPQRQGHSAASGRALEAELLEAVRREPGTVAAGLASHLPLSVEVLYERAAPASTESPEGQWPLVDTALVGPGYFEAMGTRVLQGRTFRAADAGKAVAVVNRTLAARLWPGAEALGQPLRLAGAEAVLEVVGVVADGRYRSLAETPRPFLFQSLEATSRRSAHAGEVSLGARTLIVRSRGGESSARETLRRALAGVAPELTPLRLTTLREATHLPGLLPRAMAAVFGGVAVMALLLVALGVIALVAYAANRRRHEIAVRMALGARPADVRRLLLAEAAGIALLGSTLGGAVSAPAARTLASVLATGQPLAARWLVATLLLTALVAAAALVPARRAALEDPLRSLRDH